MNNSWCRGWKSLSGKAEVFAAHLITSGAKPDKTFSI